MLMMMEFPNLASTTFLAADQLFGSGYCCSIGVVS
jgi:hypothetical protein